MDYKKIGRISTGLFNAISAAVISPKDLREILYKSIMRGQFGWHENSGDAISCFLSIKIVMIRYC